MKAPNYLKDFRGILVFSALVMTFAVGLAAWAWTQLSADARIPIHWGMNGKPNGYGSRNFLFFAPAMMLSVTVLLAAIPAIEPRKSHLLNSSKAFKIMWGVVLTFLLVLHVTMTWAALGHAVAMSLVITTGLGILLIVLGNYMGKVRSNFMFGVRTPWTLSSELSWSKTHRLAGWLFVIFGAAVLACGWVFSDLRWLTWFLLIGIPLLVVSLSAYSYLVWKNDPQRQGDRRLNAGS